MNFWSISIEQNGLVHKKMFVDRTGRMNEAKVRLYVYQLLGYDMFNRPTMHVDFILKSTILEIKCSDIESLIKGGEIIDG